MPEENHMPVVLWTGKMAFHVKGYDQVPFDMEFDAQDKVKTLQAEVRRKFKVSPMNQLLHSHKLHLEAELRDRDYTRDRLLCEFDFTRAPGEPRAHLTGNSSWRGHELHVTDYTCLRRRLDFCKIDLTEHRGMSLRQFDFVLEHLREWSLHDHWHDMWSGEPVSFDTINLYHVCDWLIKPSTYKWRCSFVEAIAEQPGQQVPKWFVSHWWGESVTRFVKGLKGHAKLRNLSDDDAYWVCAYAINQHAVGEDINCPLTETAFMRAMKNCVGVVLILDRNATPFSRVWCCFEEAMAVTSEKMAVTSEQSGSLEMGKKWILLDMATVVAGHAVVITDGLTREEQELEMSEKTSIGSGWRNKVDREADFPLTLIDKGLAVTIESAEASRPEDKVRILNFLAGTAFLNMFPEHHEKFNVVNAKLCAIFALAGWPKVMAGKWPDENGERRRSDLLSKFAEALARDKERVRLDLSFFNCPRFNDTELCRIAGSLPPMLEELTLNLGLCKSLSDLSVDKLFKNLPRSLKSLSLEFFWCELLESCCLDTLAQNMPPHLEILRLSCRTCRYMTHFALGTLFGRLPETLRILDLNFDNTPATDTALEGWSLPPGLQELVLSFAQCAITDRGITFVANVLPDGLRELSLSLECCNELTDRAVTALVRDLPLNLRVCNVDIAGCDGVSSMVKDRLDLGFRGIRNWQRQLLEEREIAHFRGAPDHVIPAMLERLDHTDERIRSGCAMALCHVMVSRGARACTDRNLTRSQDALAKRFESDGFPVRQAILEGVSKNELWKKVKLSGETLRTQLKQHEDVRFLALVLQALAEAPNPDRYADEVTQFLMSEEQELHDAAVNFVVTKSAEGPNYTTKLLGMLDIGPRAFEAAGLALSQMPKEMFRPDAFGADLPLLAKLVGHSKRAVQLWAEWAMGQLSDHEQADAYAKVMEHSHWAVRQGATAALGHVGRDAAERHIELLQKALHDAEPRVWAASVRALQYINEKAPVNYEDLAHKAFNEHKEVYELACQELLALDQLGKSADIPRAVAVALALQCRKTHRLARRRLLSMAPGKRADALVGALGHKCVAVRKAITKELASLLHCDSVPAVAPLLLDKLDDKEEAVAEGLAKVFLHFGQAALESLYDCIDDGRKNLTVRLRAVKIMGRICSGECTSEPASPASPAIPAMTRRKGSCASLDSQGSSGTLGADTEDARSFSAAPAPTFEPVTEVPPRALKVLIFCLDEKSVEMRATAAEVIGQLGLSQQAERELGRLLDDPSLEVRKAAVSAMRLAGAADAHTEQLSNCLLKREDSEMTKNVVEALGQVGTKAKPLMPVLARCLSDHDEQVREATGDTLAQFGPDAAEHVAGHLFSDHFKTRLKAVQVMRKLGADVLKAHAGSFLALAHDEKPHVSEAAREVLENMDESSLAHLLSDKADVVDIAGQELLDRAVGQCLVTPRPEQRLHPSQAFSRSAIRGAVLHMLDQKHEAAAPMASEIARCLSDPSMSVRRAAFRVLEHLDAGIPAADIDRLRPCLGATIPNEIRKEAARASGRVALTSCEEHIRLNVIEDLGNCLEAENREVREAAKMSLQQLGASTCLREVVNVAVFQLQSERWYARQLGCEVLKELADADPQNPMVVAEKTSDIVDFLADKEREVRLAVLSVFERLPPQQQKPHLAVLQNIRSSDDSQEVRDAAGQIIAAIASQVLAQQAAMGAGDDGGIVKKISSDKMPLRQGRRRMGHLSSMEVPARRQEDSGMVANLSPVGSPRRTATHGAANASKVSPTSRACSPRPDSASGTRSLPAGRQRRSL